MIKRGQDTTQEEASSKSDAALDRNASVLADWLKDMPIGQLHPLMQQPMAAMAAATAVGLGLSSQFAGFMLGAMQGLNGTSRQPVPSAPAEPPVQVKGSEPEEKPAEAPETLEPNAPVALQPVAAVVEPGKPVRKPRVAPSARVKAKPQTQVAAMSQPDDLKRIAGIGPKLEQVLNAMGVTSFADIVALTEADIARIDGELGFNGRIARDGWVEQAKALSKG